MTSSLLSVLLLLASIPRGASAADTPVSPDPCAVASRRIQEITDADQADRRDWGKKTLEEMKAVDRRDGERRVMIAGLFAQGCFKTALDYRNAALVFQHGNAPDHYYQAYLWAMRGEELGSKGSRSLAAAALDRWLMSRGFKQLYATQGHASPDTHWCSCLWPVEETATDDDRRKMGRPTLAEQMAWIDQLNAGKSCPPASVCKAEARPVPKGSLPGVDW